MGNGTLSSVGRGLVLLAPLTLLACAERTTEAAREPGPDSAAVAGLEIETLPADRGGQDLIGRRMPALVFDRWVRGAPSDAPRATLYRWWTDTCPYCSASLPAIEALRQSHESDGLSVVAVYHPKPPRETSDAEVLAMAERFGYLGAIALDTDWSVLNDFYLSTGSRTATSASFLVDELGMLRFVHPGPELFASDDPEQSQQDQDYWLLKDAILKLLGLSRP
jgi:thiol-disulfide isomerase/thioredoxin